MKKIYLLIFLCCSVLSFGQIRAVSKKVQELNAKSQQFKSYDLFSVNTDAHKMAKYFTSATDVTVLNLNENQLNRLVKDAPNYLSISVPYQNEIVEVQLYKQNVVTEDFIAKDEQGNILDFTLGEYYRGIVKGDYESLVAISFFEGDVMGVISTYEFGNVILGKSTDKQDFITYSDKNILGENPFTCGVDELEENHNRETMDFDPAMMSTTTTENCVRIYYEIARRPYAQNGSNVQNTVNWITGIQNNIGTLYSNDNINVALHEIRIWTIADPYTGSFSENLAAFRNNVTEFNGDLAHLVNFPSTTSVAYLNSLCTDARYAYSGISMSYAQVPTYSWTIMAMTHEMGHSLGSQHTHACAWNGNNTQIDGCGPLSGNPDPNNGNCASGPLPSNGGTIMSYCHLMSSVGINFLNGFGDQPGALIRATVDSKPCLGANCSSDVTTCTNAISEVRVTNLNNGSYQAQIIDNSSTEWKYQVIPFGNELVDDQWQTTTEQTFTFSGLADNQYYAVHVVNVCAGGTVGGMKTNIVLTGGFCDGTLFTDTGGTSGTYGNNQNFVKTFYPSWPTGKVSLSFNRIGLQNNQDFMYVYNSDTATSSASLFEGGTITGNNNPGPSFTSTHETGAITIKFVSDSSGALYGWEASVDCNATMSIEDISNSNDITVYPNPATSVLYIDAKKEINSVKLNDISGKTVINKKASTLKEKLNIEHLPKGVYILTVEMKGETVTKKIIKN